MNNKERIFINAKCSIISCDVDQFYHVTRVNFLRMTALIDIPKEIFNLVKLRQFEISCSLIRTIPREIGNLILLENLDICRNRIEKFPTEILNLKKLEFVSVFGNSYYQSFSDINHSSYFQTLFSKNPEVFY